MSRARWSWLLLGVGFGHERDPVVKALVKAHANEGLWLEDVPEPEPGINDVLIRVRKTGICGTDLHIYGWDAWAQKTIPVPMVVGHEFVGEVVGFGSNVNSQTVRRSSTRSLECR